MQDSITIIPGAHEPKPHPRLGQSKQYGDFYSGSCPDHYIKGETEVVWDSFIHSRVPWSEVHLSSASFIRCAIEAWGHHSHLVLRPDDLWFTILVQMTFYMTKHAEDVRHIFVSHSGQEEIQIWADDWEEVIGCFRKAIQSRIKAEWLSDWISPSFSTSTSDDDMTATVLMMGLMKAYFFYSGGVVYGIPSITLLGTKQDWERLLEKAKAIDRFGKSAAGYRARLLPLLTRVVSSFDDSTAADTRAFWDEMVQAKKFQSNVCGIQPTAYVVSGWITGFFYWDQYGKPSHYLSQGIDVNNCPGALQYDGIHYGCAPLEDLAVGYATADFRLLNYNGSEIDGFVAAGSIGKRIRSGAPEGYHVALQAVQPEESQHQPIANPSTDSKSKRKRLSSLFKKSARPGPCKHSTMQPLSRWFLACPRPPVCQMMEDISELETSGDTIDAINASQTQDQENHGPTLNTSSRSLYL